MKLVQALHASPGTASLIAEDFNSLVALYPTDVQAAARSIADQLVDEPEAINQRLAALAPVLKAGNADAGKHVFCGTRVACSVCHRVGSQGGDIGPDLSAIARIRGTKIYSNRFCIRVER